ncbi:MAG: relaxase domain-containing protein [Acidimicrobiales bacterium]
MVGWIEDHAHTRYRQGSQVVVVDAEGIVAATFRQHTSRSLDPQVHTHVAIANRVLGPGWALAGAGCPHHQMRPAQPVRPLPRRSASGALPQPGRELA